jgi:hypothetical protein
MIKVERCHLALQGKLVEGSQTVKSKNCLWLIECHWKPLHVKELHALMYYMPTFTTVTEVNSDAMDAASVKYCESQWTR